MDEYRIKRDGGKDLVFRGERVGEGDQGGPGERCNWNRGTDVAIYVTESGRVVTSVTQWSQWEDESDWHRAAVHATGAEAFAWLLEDCGGELGRASKEAWVEACSSSVMLEGDDVEVIS